MGKLIFAIILAVACGSLYSGLGTHDFVWADKSNVFRQEVGVENASPAAKHSQFDLTSIWKVQRHQAFEPLAPTVWAGLERLAKPQNANEWAHDLHLLSLGTHLAAGVVVFLILALILGNQAAAGLGALFFIAHPLQVEPVAYISAYKYVLAGFLSLTALWQYLVYVQAKDGTLRGRSLRHYYIATVLFLLALTTSVAAAVTPLIAAVLARLLPKKTSLLSTRPASWPLVPWSIVTIFPFVFFLRQQNTAALASQLPFWAKPVVAADAVSFYLLKIFAPVMIGPDYGRSPSFLLRHWWGYFTWLAPAALFLILAYWRSTARAWYTAALTLLVIALLPFLGLFYFEAQATSTVFDRFAYLGLLAPALAAGYTVSMPKKSWQPLVVIAALFAAAYLSRGALGHWQNDAALWQHAIAVNPMSPIAHASLGDAARRQGNWAEARDHYMKVLASNTLTPDIYFYLGEIEQEHGDREKATTYYQRTLALDPMYAQAWVRLGMTFLDQKQDDLALEHLKKAVELAPESEGPLRHLGMLHVRQGEYAEAVPYLTKALRLAEEAGATQAQAANHALLGLTLVNTHQPEIAQSHLETALRLNPDLADANQTLADIYYGKNQFDLARSHYEKALAQGSRDFQIYANLGHILARGKEHSKAVPFFTKALELKPNSALLLNELGESLFRLRQLKEAQESFQKALALNPNLAGPHHFLGDIARWQGKEQDAVAEYHRALSIDPAHPEANYRLGNYYMKQEKISLAIKHYQAALKTQPDDPKLIYSLKKAEKARSGGANATVEF